MVSVSVIGLSESIVSSSSTVYPNIHEHFVLLAEDICTFLLIFRGKCVVVEDSQSKFVRLSLTYY